MDEYEDKFPQWLGDEEKAALEWKIEGDYRESSMAAIDFKDAYIAFAVRFYTRSLESLENVVTHYRAYSRDKKRRTLADAFLTDMKSRLRARELAYN